MKILDFIFNHSKVEDATQALKESVDKGIIANEFSVKSCERLWNTIAHSTHLKRRYIK